MHRNQGVMAALFIEIGPSQRRLNMHFSMRSISAAVLMAAWQLSIPAATAQVEPPAPGLSAPAPSIPDQKLDAAAAALERVASLKQEYEQRLAATPARPDQERIVAEANDALAKAITDQGLSIDEYDSIMQVAQNDLDIRGKIIQRLHPPTEQK
jgi:hypothetical protein